eukprot:2897363-Prymnesium_polylepis.2
MLSVTATGALVLAVLSPPTTKFCGHQPPVALPCQAPVAPPSASLVPSGRRAAVVATLAAPLLAAARPRCASAFPLAIAGAGLKRGAAQQKQCFDDGECAEAVPYYAIECERGDAECLQRKRQL